MSSALFIYVHGFNSSPESIKARLFGEYLAAHKDLHNENYIVPQLSHWPAEAMRQLESIVTENRERQIILIGSSLGGYYSIWLTEHYENCISVMVNPAIYPYRLLSEWLGDNENIYTHEHYILTREHLQQLESMVVDQIKDPSRYMLLVQSADETLDYREAVDFFDQSIAFVQPGGSHGFDQFEKLIPAIIGFSQGRLELPEAIPLPPFSE